MLLPDKSAVYWSKSKIRGSAILFEAYTYVYIFWVVQNANFCLKIALSAYFMIWKMLCLDMMMMAYGRHFA